MQDQYEEQEMDFIGYSRAEERAHELNLTEFMDWLEEDDDEFEADEIISLETYERKRDEYDDLVQAESNAATS